MFGKGDRTRIYDKIDQFNTRMSDHERQDSKEHAEMLREIRGHHEKTDKTLGEMRTDIASLVAKTESNDGRIDSVEGDIGEVKKDLSSVKNETDRLKEWREERVDFWKVVRDRVIFVTVPVLIAGLVFLFAESFGWIDLIPTTPPK